MRADIVEEAAFGVFVTHIHDFEYGVQIDFRYTSMNVTWGSTSMGGDEPYATIGHWYGVLTRIARNEREKQPKRVRNGATK